MNTPPSAGQASLPEEPPVPAALSTLAHAARGLREQGVVEVSSLLAAYRALSPIAHAGAKELAPDLAFLAATSSFGAPLLGAEHVLVTTSVPRAPPLVSAEQDSRRARLSTAPGLEASADALTMVLGVALEAAKLQALFEEPSLAEGDLVEAVARVRGTSLAEVLEGLGAPDRDHAGRLLESVLHAGSRRTVELERQPPPVVDEVVLDVAIDDDGPLYVLAGATERVQDLLSPFVRRLAPALTRLAGGRSSDELYAALPVLFAEEPNAHEERLQVEAREGFTPCGDALVLRFERIDPSRADERARPLLRALKQSRARAVLCGREPETLRSVLARVGRRVRVVAILGEALGGRSSTPDVVMDARTGHPFDFDNALAENDESEDRASVAMSPPSLGLSPHALLDGGIACAPLLAPLLLEAAHARATGWLSRRARLAAATSPPGDSAAASAVALRCLARMSGAAPLPKRSPRRPG